MSRSLSVSRRTILHAIAAAASICVDPAAARAATGRLAIGGTGAAQGTMKLLAEAFIAQNPGVSLDLPRSLGTTGGIRALLAGAIDIATSARPVTAAEQAAGASAQPYGRTPFAFVTSLREPPSNLTSSDVREIYALKHRTWPDATPIRVILRPKSDADTNFLIAQFPGIEAALDAAHARQTIPVAKTDQDNLDEAENLAGSFTGSALAAVRSERRNLRVLPLDGIAPELATIENGTYRHVKTLYLVTSAATSPVARAFVDFVRSAQGSSLLLQSTTLPIRA